MFTSIDRIAFCDHQWNYFFICGTKYPPEKGDKYEGFYKQDFKELPIIETNPTVVCITDCESLVRITQSLEGVERLYLRNLPELIEIPYIDGLKILYISDCPKLFNVNIPLTVRHLTMEKTGALYLPRIEGLEHLSVRSTVIKTIPAILSLKSLFCSLSLLEILPNLPSLTNCHIDYGGNLREFPILENLTTLDLSYVKKLKALPKLPKLAHLQLFFCDIETIEFYDTLETFRAVECPVLRDVKIPTNQKDKRVISTAYVSCNCPLSGLKDFSQL